MAKKAKKVKKRKYTKHVPEYVKTQASKNMESLQDAMNIAKSGDTINVHPSVAERPRASESSYVFIHGNKVLVRNLTDEMLNERYEQANISGFEARRAANNLEKLEHNLFMEQRYRGLK